jgi:hypothetical protein
LSNFLVASLITEKGGKKGGMGGSGLVLVGIKYGGSYVDVSERLQAYGSIYVLYCIVLWSVSNLERQN